MNIKHITIVGLAAVFAVQAAVAGTAETDSAEITRKVSPLLKGAKIEKVVPSAYAGLYEVFTEQGMLYTDKTGSFVLSNATMIDTKNPGEPYGTTRRPVDRAQVRRLPA